MPKNKPRYLHTSFARRIMLWYMILIASLLICFGVISYALMRMNVSSSSIQTMSNTGNLISGLLNNHVQAIASELDVVTENPSLKDFISGVNSSASTAAVKNIPEAASITESLGTIPSHNSDISYAWVIAEQSGILIDSSGNVISAEEYGLSGKQWYNNFITGRTSLNGCICTGIEPGISNSEENVISIIIPVSSDSNVYAFCGVEIPAGRVFSVLSDYTFNTGSYPIVAANSEVIYSPTEKIFKDKFSLSDRTLINIISQKYPNSGKIDNYVSENDGTVYYYIEKNSFTGWNIIVLFDSSEINGNIYQTFVQQFLVLLCLIGLVFVFGFSILRRESRLLEDIHVCTEEIAAGNLNYRIQKTDRTELGHISENINKIAEMFQAKNLIINSFNTTDVLTGLQNRSKLYEHLDDIIHTREKGRSRFAVMFIDIDNFKWLNETLGHNFGDAVLATFGTLLKEQLPENSVFRFSGDEFIVVQEFDTDYSIVYEVIEKLHRCFNNPLEIMNDKIYIKFSVGVSIYPDDDLTTDMLLRDADLALHRAKDSGKDRVAFYTNAHKNKNVYSKAALAQSLNEALKKEELFLHYQPIVSTSTCDIHGFEVLLRWVSPEFGVVSPADFISIAEESGAIIQIGTWIFESACRTLKQINENLNPDVIMSINVSPVQLRRDNYIEHVKRVLEITQVNQKNIQLEITESTLIDFTDSKSNVINEINDLGIALALDDFGTGYSSLNYLKNFPIKCLKIDKSFIDEINNNKRDYAITDSIIDLVHNLGIRTVAEGIETVGQYDFLAKMKCDYIQGYLMSKPLDESAVIEFVEKYNALHKPDKHKLEENEKKLADERKQRDMKKKEAAAENTSSPTEDYIISK